MGLTEKQNQFLHYLTEKLAEDGRAPSLRQAATDMGVSHTAVAQMAKNGCSKIRSTR